ncbi:MAG: hypothetical protein LC687_02615, partial [Actinobacteria bacterium]|nr:hypothetical protein [Actinomycetota bacterium]
MASHDEVLSTQREPQAADFVDRPEEWLATDDENFVICGVEFASGEFTELERAEWIKVRDKHKLSETEQKYRDILTELGKNEQGTLLASKRDRLKVIHDEISSINKSTAPLEWTEDLEQHVGELAAAADKLQQSIDELTAPQDKKLYDRMDEVQSTLNELKSNRDPAFLEMTWKIAVLRHNEKRTLEEWLKEARGSDRLSAQELVYAGNFTWE